MKTTEKEASTSTSTSTRRGGGRSGRGDSRGRGGGRGGGSKSASARGRGVGIDQRRSAGRGTNNHGRHPRQPANQKQTHQGGGRGRGYGRPRSSSYSDKRGDYFKAKKSGPYEHLFCSERHAFALSRVFYPRNNDQFLLPNQQHAEENSNRHRIVASDEQLEQWWESVKIVRCHVPFSEVDSSEESERCPICLDDEMICPFISPCSHKFCLPCVLGYLNSVAKDLNDESDRIHKTKQNVRGNSGVVVGSTDIKTRASVTSVRARCPMCSSGSAMVLNAGEAMITYKDLRPVIFVPTVAISANSTAGDGKSGTKGEGRHNQQDNSPQRGGTRMKFVKLHRVKSCPSPYLPLPKHFVRGANTSVSTEQQRLPDLPDGDDDAEECIYSRQYFVGMKEYENVLQRDLNDLKNYRENTVHCQMDPREDWNVSMAIEAVQAAQRRWLGGGSDDGGFQGMELEAKLAAVDSNRIELTLPRESDASDDERTKAQSTSQKNTALLQPGSFYLHQNSSQEEAGEFLYYQSADGQPCFLSGIDVALLLHEFSLHQPTESTAAAEETQDGDYNRDQPSTSTNQNQPSNKPRDTLPLPDELTATILDQEQLTVTTSLIKRKPFLSHIPLTSSVSFVEIDWYSGGGDGGKKSMLSHRTMTQFRGELQRRKAERLRATKLEQKADKIARAKSEKEELRRRRELLGSYVDEGARQTIDPDDEFFQRPAASFDESEEGAPPSATFQFNEVCATGGVWPELSSSPGSTALALQSTGMAPSSPPPTWGRNSSIAAKVVKNHFPSLAESSAPVQKPQSKEACREKGDGPWGSR